MTDPGEKKEMDLVYISSDDDAPADSKKRSSKKGRSGCLGFGLDTLDSIDFGNEQPQPTTEHVPPPTPSKEFVDFKERVCITLLSTGLEGYESSAELNRDLYCDTGLDGAQLAKKFGYRSLDAFLRSDEMKDRVLIDKGNTYRGIPRPPYKEIFDVMATSYGEKCKRETELRGEADGRTKGVPLLLVTKIGLNVDKNDVHPPLVMSTAKPEKQQKKKQGDGGDDAPPRRPRLEDAFGC